MIDWTKPVRTKGSKNPVKILSIDGPGQQSVVGFLEPMKGADIDRDVYQWYPGGGFNVDPLGSSMDLENVPEPKPVYSVRAIDVWAGDGYRSGWVIEDEKKTQFAITGVHNNAETIMNLLNGSK